MFSLDANALESQPARSAGRSQPVRQHFAVLAVHISVVLRHHRPVLAVRPAPW